MTQDALGTALALAKSCAVEESGAKCGRVAVAKDMCHKHWRRNRKHGDPLYTAHYRGASLSEKIVRVGWVEVQGGTLTTPCWEWAGSRSVQGYGKTTRPGTAEPISAHRASYECWVGPLVPGLVVRHKCDNPPCVNPEHLELGTYAENLNDAVERLNFRPARGESAGNSKLTHPEVEEIRALRTGGMLMKDIAARFNVSRSTIGYILRGDTWRGE